ncbi:pentatricopeptide repeat-containing protein At2g17033 [Aristolochia californica]|uniref:pentatricopeptide repeat-containing protein At2g17033 n=1 Tax=Aristolochia californica TaxID=171875 RepID=UPI0035D6DCB5
MGTRLQLFLPPASSPRCGLGKSGRRLLSVLDSTDAASSNRLIRKFIASSPKHLALDTLSHLLSKRLGSFALPMYRRISEASWYKWNPKLLAELVALLENQHRCEESQALMSNSLRNLPPLDIGILYCELIESYAKNDLKQHALESFSRVKQIPSIPSSIHRQAHGALITGLCFLQLPEEAERIVQVMENEGSKPTPFELRAILLSYGRLGLFKEMKRIINQMAELDIVSANMVLSCFGQRHELSKMLHWLQEMRQFRIDFSLRTYNSVLNACPEISSIVQDPRSLPLSMEELFEQLEKTRLAQAEMLLIKELIQSNVLAQSLKWSDSEGKLDLHGMHLGSAYLILLQWVEELRHRLCVGEVSPVEISVVCGSGKNSSIRGESPVKKLVSELMFQMNSPLKIDRKNVGRFVAKGKAAKQWLCG